MNADCLKLTTYTGERDRARGGFLADVLLDLYEHHGFQASVMLRGTEGFGIGHHLHTQRLLTLSEDLPLVTVAVDARERIEAVADEVAALCSHGLVTLERARLLTEPISHTAHSGSLDESVKLTIYCGRQERAAGRPAYQAVVELLQRNRIAGATVLLGVDGTVHGVRRRGRFIGRNAEVPLMIISVGDGERVAAVLPQLAGILSQPLMTLERVRLCKRDGQLLAEPRWLPETDDAGLGVWQKLMIYAGERADYEGHPLHVALIRRLRAEGAAGATALRGFWGYHGDHAPHGDSAWSVRRRVAVVTVVVDRPERIRRWFAIVDELTRETGLVTSEIVPAARAAAAAPPSARLELARLEATSG
jgi:PII-like signaling protein